MEAIRRVLIAIIAALMTSTAAIVVVFIVQRALMGDIKPVVILGVSILTLFRLLFIFRRVGRGFSGLSGYRRYVRKDE